MISELINIPGHFYRIRLLMVKGGPGEYKLTIESCGVNVHGKTYCH